MFPIFFFCKMATISEYDFANLNDTLHSDQTRLTKKVVVVGPLVEYFLFLLIFYFLYKWNWSEVARQAQHLKAFPGPKTLPFIGNGNDLLFKPTDYYKWSWNMCKKWGGDAVLTWRLSFPMLWISSYETAIQLLSNPKFVSKSKDIDLFWRQEGANGLSSCPAHLHTTRRKLLSPGYTRQVVGRSVYIFTEESQKLVEKLKPLAESQDIFEIMEMIMPCSFRIICRSTFGDNFISELSDEEAIRQMHAIHDISQKFTQRIMSPYLWLRNDFIYFNLTKEGRNIWKTWKIVSDFGEMAMNRRRQDRLRLKENGQNGVPSYLDMLLDLVEKGDLKENDILGELNNYIVAAYDTTALAAAWALFALALNDRSHQDKIFQEIQSIFGDVPTSELNITAADTKKMKYLELSIKEALRLFPASPMLPRNANEDMTLKDGRIIPRGTDVYIMVDMIHRDPKYFEEPNVFKPERHLKPNPAFIPFSSGARNCIGQMFAMHQIKVELALLLRDFVWETVDKEETLPRVFQALMVPAEGIRFKISRREK